MTIEERVHSALEADAALVTGGDPIGPEEAMRRGGRRRRTKRLAATAAVIVGLVGFVYLVIPPSSTPVADPGIDLNSVPSPSEVLADRIVTSVEWNTAGEAVVQCLANRGIQATFDPADGAFSAVGAGAEEALKDCTTTYLTLSMQRVWADQNYDPVAEYEFYKSVVECTEARTGVDYGEMTQGVLGYMSTDAHRTINRALDQAPDAYDQCFDEIAG